MKKITILAVLVTGTSMAATPEAINFLKEMEGFRASAYEDGSQKAIGYGTSVEYARSKGFVGSLSKEEATNLLEIRLNEDYQKLTAVKIHELKASAQVAIQSAYYNAPALVGPRLKRFLLNADYDSASKELAWGHVADRLGCAQGLINRRIKEANLIREAYNLPKLSTPKSVEEFRHFRKLWYNRTS